MQPQPLEASVRQETSSSGAASGEEVQDPDPVLLGRAGGVPNGIPTSRMCMQESAKWPFGSDAGCGEGDLTSLMEALHQVSNRSSAVRTGPADQVLNRDQFSRAQLPVLSVPGSSRLWWWAHAPPVCRSS